MKIGLISSSLFAIVSASLIFACGGSSDDESEIDDSTDAITAREGDTCGGFAGTRCTEGLRCNYGRGLNTGTCVTDSRATRQGAGEGETCGGTARVACRQGLTCKLRDPSSRTSRGTCKAPPQVCQAMPACDDGDEQIPNSDHCLQDVACYRRVECGRTIWCTGGSAGSSEGEGDGAGPGEMCGGFAGTTCRPGLRCDNSMGVNTGRCR